MNDSELFYFLFFQVCNMYIAPFKCTEQKYSKCIIDQLQTHYYYLEFFFYLM